MEDIFQIAILFGGIFLMFQASLKYQDEQPLLWIIIVLGIVFVVKFLVDNTLSV